MPSNAIPRLINPPFSDPGLFVDVGRRRGAMLFDIGRYETLTDADLLRVSHLFISHTHMDHFMGFDGLVRTLLGRGVRLEVYGPAGLITQVGAKLSAYHWNLVGGYTASPVISVTEMHPGFRLRQSFACRNAFVPERAPVQLVPSRTLMDDGTWRVTAEILDHRTACLGFRLHEKNRHRVDTDALARQGLSTGPWLADLKSLADTGSADARTMIRASATTGPPVTLPAAPLIRSVLRKKTGTAYAYITDAVFSPGNIEKVIRLARGAAHLFIEAPFLDADADHAAAKRHLTARQAGTLAGRSGVSDFTIFHFSQRYREDPGRLEAEAMRAYLECRSP